MTHKKLNKKMKKDRIHGLETMTYLVNLSSFPSGRSGITDPGAFSFKAVQYSAYVTFFSWNVSKSVSTRM